jgi:ComF family protein
MPLPFAHSASKAGNAVYASGERLGFRAAAPYTDVAAHVVGRLKYQDRQDLAAPMAKLMSHAGRDLLDRADFIAPVPLHRTRMQARKFNQSALLANLLKRPAHTRLSHDLVARVRPTRQQVGLSQAARLENMRGAFALFKGAVDYIEGRRIVLVDDVITTGATARACARVFLDAGAARVDVLAFARVVFDDSTVNGV